MTNFILHRSEKDNYINKLSDINKTTFDIISKAKKNDKNVFIHITLVDDKTANELKKVIKITN